MKKLWITLAAVVVVAAIALGGLGCYLVNFAIVRTESSRDVAPDSVVAAEDAAVISANLASIQEKKESWLAQRWRNGKLSRRMV